MGREPGTYSRPVKVANVVCRLTDEEKQRVQEMAERVGVTLSYAMRVGMTRYLEDAMAELEARQTRLPVDVRPTGALT